MTLQTIFSVEGTRRLLLTFLRPSDIINLVVSTTIRHDKDLYLTSYEKLRYLRIEREVFKDTRIIEKIILEGYTVLLLGDGINNLLSRYTKKYSSPLVASTKIIPICVIVLRPTKDINIKYENSHGSCSIPLFGKVYKKGWNIANECYKYNNRIYIDMPVPLSVPQLDTGGYSGISSAWYTNTSVTEDNIRLLTNMGYLVTDIKSGVPGI